MKREQVPQRGMGELSGGDPASEQASNPLRGLKARVGGVKGEEDAGAAPEGRGDPLHPLGPEGCDCRYAPLGKGEPVKNPFSDDCPGRGRDAQAQAPAWGLGAPGTGESGRDRLPGRRASGRESRRRRERRPFRRTAPHPVP